MPLYRMAHDRLVAVPTTSFAAEKLLERTDLQRLLRSDLSPLGGDLLLLAEEYSNWEDSNRRIDLLCLRDDAALVVVEIKRTSDGGHMELQALRYAAMVSGMTMQQAYETYAATHKLPTEQAASAILDFLGSDFDESDWARDVAIVLVAADFSTELTTAVLWLNDRGIDIKCIRLAPYRLDAEILIDATQIIPLPEAADYAVTIRRQEDERRQGNTVRQELLSKFFAQLIARSRTKTALLANRKATTDHWIDAGVGRTGFKLSVSLKKLGSRVECYVSLPSGPETSQQAFDLLSAQRVPIEESFGQQLNWDSLPGRDGCRVSIDFEGGWKSPETEWPALQEKLIDALMRLEAALRKPIQAISV